MMAQQCKDIEASDTVGLDCVGMSKAAFGDLLGKHR